MPEIPTGNSERIEIRCSPETRTAFKKIAVEITDGAGTHEEALQQLIAAYRRHELIDQRDSV